MADPSTPASVEYWDEFYSEGLGVKCYEWYDISAVDLGPLLIPIFTQQSRQTNPSHFLKVLHIGAGNSMLFNALLQDPLFPENVQITNIDISLEAIHQMEQLQNQEAAAAEKKQLVSRRKNLLKSSEKLNRMIYQHMDACKMDFSNASFDIVLDKGTLDALLSHGGDEDGTNEQVLMMLNEVRRVLKPGGSFLLITGNGSAVLDPYLYQYDWKVEQKPIQRRAKKGGTDFGGLSMWFYSMFMQ